MDQEMRRKILAAYDLLQGDLTTIQKFESVRTLIRGINPKIDDILEKLSKARSDLSKIQQGELIELSLENLPEKSEKDKKRKRAILLFLKNWNLLKSEVERVRDEIENAQGESSSATNILVKAKGPLGIITIAAVIIVGAGLFLNAQKPQMEELKNPSPSQSKEKINPVRSKSSNGVKVINFNNKKIPLTELTITGGERGCLDQQQPADHYHAKDHRSAKALDGSIVFDPGGCGFGKVSDTEIEEI